MGSAICLAILEITKMPRTKIIRPEEHMNSRDLRLALWHSSSSSWIMGSISSS